MRRLLLSFRWLAGLWCLLLAGCIDPYSPNLSGAAPGYLVVDGFINPGGVTTIKLSRTYDVSAKTAPPVESKATVYVEEEGGARFALVEGVAGSYASSSLTLSPGKRYRLHLTTKGGKEYASDYVAAKVTPPIDKVTWRADNNGLTVYVSAHDDARATQYYGWDYTETWEIIPILRPIVEYNKSSRSIIEIKTPYPTRCWGNENSSSILVGKTTALSQDVVSNFPLRALSSYSNRLFSKYSILVKQYALSKEEYAYLELLRKNTENIGTIFDPQPAQLTGNVHCLSTESELAIGFVGVHSVEEKRLFVDRTELPTQWRLYTGYESCMQQDTVLKKDIVFYFDPGGLLPVNPFYDIKTMTLLGYTASTLDCVDCRTRGTAIKPSFWP